MIYFAFVKLCAQVVHCMYGIFETTEVDPYPLVHTQANGMIITVSQTKPTILTFSERNYACTMYF